MFFLWSSTLTNLSKTSLEFVTFRVDSNSFLSVSVVCQLNIEPDIQISHVLTCVLALAYKERPPTPSKTKQQLNNKNPNILLLILGRVLMFHLPTCTLEDLIIRGGLLTVILRLQHLELHISFVQSLDQTRLSKSSTRCVDTPTGKTDGQTQQEN